MVEKYLERSTGKQDNLHIKEFIRLPSPRELKADLPTDKSVDAVVAKSRKRIIEILGKRDPRLLVIAGPCSIHDEAGAIDYATRLNGLREKFSDKMEIVMRVYFEKPRTTVGWKGLINDPNLNGSQDIEKGLRLARRILLKINGIGLPTATEFLDPIVPQYTADLISWAAIGARTTESQTHREMASGLSMPVGLKNATDGSLQIAIDAMKATQYGHSFLGINEDGITSIVRTTGNPNSHVVLRGGHSKTNYDYDSIRQAAEKLRSEKLPEVVMVDCSHANSRKKHELQQYVWNNVINQYAGKINPSIIGLMVESNINEGSQDIPKNLAELRYGVSITDPCVSWETTEHMLGWAYEKL
ncbi:MAG: 3-deoxy-7-phosphoheptulonate synthase [Candidatus Micrarchaeota archaeon]|nr:3-deoxy-7-phosphoheptulonate synthase [Candidatus Micrarchaeota archaeon]